nr:caspase family protein [uncultured Methanoregula sp.]
MRKALVVGIDYYENIQPLNGCVNDAKSIKEVLERNGDGTKNFEVKCLVSTTKHDPVTKRNLKDDITDLFKDNNDEVALFYFSGHGHLEATGGYLVTSDAKDGDDGFSMSELLTLANNSRSKNKIIILDCCHSGQAGNSTDISSAATLYEGTTILTASGSNQYSIEENGSGVFTTLFVDAMNGAAANLVGEITPGSVYAHIDQSLGPWDQRPVFKTNIKSFISLRKVEPPITYHELKQITELFPTCDEEFALDPEFEPESKKPVKEKTAKFSVLQKYNRINLVVPVGEEHMYFAAMNSKSCRLTKLGKHYWKLVKNEKI